MSLGLLATIVWAAWIIVHVARGLWKLAKRG
jgi:hypothetical protein